MASEWPTFAKATVGNLRGTFSAKAGLPTEARQREGWRRGDSHPRPKANERRRATLHSRPCLFAPGVKERRKPPETSPEKSHRRRPRQPATTSLLNDVRSPARRLTRANAHRLLSCESELRVRSCGFPPDLRVSGARQRILRLSTPVETSRPPSVPLYGAAQMRSTDSIRWSCWLFRWTLAARDGRQSLSPKQLSWSLARPATRRATVS
jgi:hypothetical protein